MSFCLRVKSQVIFTIWPLATHSNFTIENFATTTMASLSNRMDLPYLPIDRLAQGLQYSAWNAVPRYLLSSQLTFFGYLFKDYFVGDIFS